MCACVHTSSRTCSRRRLTWSIARSRWASEPGSCMPQSNRTMPWPEATAQALQCGTPGNGSGRRRRHAPGRTRSPRPTSRVRVGLRTPRDGTVPHMEEPERVAREYFAALARRDVEAARTHLADDLRATMHGLADFD